MMGLIAKLDHIVPKDGDIVLRDNTVILGAMVVVGCEGGCGGAAAS
jgi:hypothetical protein